MVEEWLTDGTDEHRWVWSWLTDGTDEHRWVGDWLTDFTDEHRWVGVLALAERSLLQNNFHVLLQKSGVKFTLDR